LREKAQSNNPMERANALELLILMEGTGSLPLLFQAIKDAHAFVRQKAARLMASGYHRDFPKYLTAALADEDPQVRELSARALASYRLPEVTEALLSLVKDDVIWVRIAAYESLAAQREDAVLPVFLKQLAQEEPMAQSSLLKCIGLFRGNASKGLILHYLQSDDAEIRKGACEALAGWKDRDIVFRLFALFETDPDWRVRVTAIRILADLKPFGLQDALLQSLKTDNDRLVRQEILTALRKLPLHSPPEEVYELLAEEELSDDAFEFLHSCREQFGAILLQHAGSQPPQVRRLIKTATE
ncbi:MAG TPA: HEAT repeat domain-containing protein, partial [Acidobacteriota bacterium]|nr:HEAT repeat domain-containing protein [Acidobacteriota bacterium]